MKRIDQGNRISEKEEQGGPVACFIFCAGFCIASYGALTAMQHAGIAG